MFIHTIPLGLWYNSSCGWHMPSYKSPNSSTSISSSTRLLLLAILPTTIPFNRLIPCSISNLAIFWVLTYPYLVVMCNDYKGDEIEKVQQRCVTTLKAKQIINFLWFVSKPASTTYKLINSNLSTLTLWVLLDLTKLTKCIITVNCNLTECFVTLKFSC